MNIYLNLKKYYWGLLVLRYYLGYIVYVFWSVFFSGIIYKFLKLKKCVGIN